MSKTAFIQESPVEEITNSDSLDLPYVPDALQRVPDWAHLVGGSFPDPWQATRRLGPGPLPAHLILRLVDGLSEDALRQLRQAIDNALGSTGSTVGSIYESDLSQTPYSFMGEPVIEIETVPIQTEDDPPPRAFTAFKEIGDWLDAPDDEVAALVQIGRTTPYSWKRDGREPRKGSARRIYEIHSTLAAIRDRFGEGGLRNWLNRGDPSPRALILAGDLQAVDRSVHELLFRRRDTGIDLAWQAEEDSAVGVDESRRRPEIP